MNKTNQPNRLFTVLVIWLGLLLVVAGMAYLVFTYLAPSSSPIRERLKGTQSEGTGGCHQEGDYISCYASSSDLDFQPQFGYLESASYGVDRLRSVGKIRFGIAGRQIPGFPSPVFVVEGEITL
jgi:hypothetical protein